MVAAMLRALFARLAARALAEPPASPREWALGRPADAGAHTARS